MAMFSKNVQNILFYIAVLIILYGAYKAIANIHERAKGKNDLNEIKIMKQTKKEKKYCKKIFKKIKKKIPKFLKTQNLEKKTKHKNKIKELSEKMCSNDCKQVKRLPTLTGYRAVLHNFRCPDTDTSSSSSGTDTDTSEMMSENNMMTNSSFGIMSMDTGGAYDKMSSGMGDYMSSDQSDKMLSDSELMVLSSDMGAKTVGDMMNTNTNSMKPKDGKKVIVRQMACDEYCTKECPSMFKKEWNGTNAPEDEKRRCYSADAKNEFCTYVNQAEGSPWLQQAEDPYPTLKRQAEDVCSLTNK